MLSICVSTYNGEKYLAEQIESIRNQTYNNFKLYITDDGSTDKTIEIISV
ncbi:MAG: glycosyltransferase, partial [Prevotellaceae bacterium]|nr:glycosyltransferase [Prevotellaceae bacterium]